MNKQMYSLYRKKIIKALAAYKESVRQNKLLFEDTEYKDLLKKEYELFEQEIFDDTYYSEKMQEIIKTKYPLGEWGTVYDNAKILVETMTKGVPEYKNIDIMNDIVFHPKMLDQFIELAEKI